MERFFRCFVHFIQDINIQENNVKNFGNILLFFSVYYYTSYLFIAQASIRQINMAVLFWYLVKSDSSVRYYVYSTVPYTEQVTYNKVPEQYGHVKTGSATKEKNKFFLM